MLPFVFITPATGNNNNISFKIMLKCVRQEEEIRDTAILRYARVQLM